MCVAETSVSRRRHRPAYLAPTRRHDDGEGNDAEHIEVGREPLVPVQSTPQTGDLGLLPNFIDYDGDLAMQMDIEGRTDGAIRISAGAPNSGNSIGQQSAPLSWLKVISRGCMDILLLIVITIVSFFFYDVEVAIVKVDEDSPVRRSNDILAGSRVVLRNEIPPSPPTSLQTRRGVSDGIV